MAATGKVRKVEMREATAEVRADLTRTAAAPRGGRGVGGGA